MANFDVFGQSVSTDDPNEIDQIMRMLAALAPTPPPPAKSAVEQVAEIAMANSSAPDKPTPVPGSESREWLKEDSAVIPASVDPEPKKVTPAHLPRQITPRPKVYVTEAQLQVMNLLRHHPEGLKTKKIAELLRWKNEKATRVTTLTERVLQGYTEPIVERIPHTYTYRITEYGRWADYEVVAQPSRYVRETG